MAYARIEEGFWTDPKGKIWRVISAKKRPFQEKYKTRSIALRNYVFERDGYVCRNCGKTETLVLDHVKPLRAGGTNHPNNLQCLCHSCNSKKVKTDREKYPYV